MNYPTTSVKLLSVAVLSALASPIIAQEESVEEIVIWGGTTDRYEDSLSPASILRPEDFRAINVATTEDVVKYEPSLVIRRRFIGDSNGVLGMRGSNMFQTSRSMVFADGVPLHYLLQSRWNGAPRWTMVSASEIAQVAVLYGPFSAEYSGNAMGGVVEIETAIPQQREFHFDSSYFSQSYSDYGFDDTVNGYKSFFSYGDRFDNTSVYFSVNRLDNESQPQTFRYGSSSSASNPLAVNGSLLENDERGNLRNWFMDTGIVNTETNNYKAKVGHDFDHWSVLLNLAYEDRTSIDDSSNTYLRDTGGNPVYGGHVVENGRQFFVPASRFAASYLERDSLNIGLRLRGELADNLELEANVSRFEVLRDETRSSSTHPNDPAHTLNGQVSEFGDTGWDTAEVKFKVSDLGVDGLQLITGLRQETYRLNLDIFSSDNYQVGAKTAYTGRSGGETEIAAAFAQFEWQLSSRWDAAFGLRYEDFESKSGYYDSDDASTPEFDLTRIPARGESKLSPKFSVGFTPNETWRFRYSAAQAYRFPIVEELFSQFEAYNAISVSNPGLKPEDGEHHNLMVERAIAGGFVRLNYFTESVKDVIEAQATILDGGTSLRTFIPVDEIETSGLEFISNIDGLLASDLDVRFNLVYTDSEIIKNSADTSIEGNVYPRMPEWRGNLLATYNLSDSWNIGLNYQYASDSYGRTDNRDIEARVYGAQDGYKRLGIKSSYYFANGVSLGLGVDNVTDEVAFVAHPWPGRTFYATLSYDL